MTDGVETLVTGLHLAEAPRLDEDGTLYFTDVLAGRLYRLPPGGTADRIGQPHIDMAAGCVVGQRETVICSDRDGLTRVHPASGSAARLDLIDPDRVVRNVNDIEADRDGGIWGGVIDRAAGDRNDPIESWAPGPLFRVDRTGAVTVAAELKSPNGLGFSPDGQIFYAVQSAYGVWAYDLGQDHSLRNAKLFARIDDPDGPHGCDGLEVDAEGGVWVACYLSSELVRYRPDGTLDRRVPVPMSPTSLIFGGADMCDVYVAGGDFYRPGNGGILKLRAEIPGKPSFKAAIWGA
jgi:sugar lactone lactonase YvrE